MIGLGMGFGIGKSSPLGNLDSDARAYFSALSAAGTTATSAQKKAVSDFIRAEKAASRWASHKRIFLPIWGAATPNAICLKSLSTGTFINSPTQGAGFVQGNDSSSYFSYGISPNATGLVAGSASTFMILLEKPSAKPMGLLVPPSLRSLGFAQASSTAIGYSCGQIASLSNVADAIQNGIYIASETATNSRYLRVRRSSGVLNLQTNTVDNGSTSYPSSNMVALCGANPSPYAYSNAKLGSFGMGLGFSTADSDAFTGNLKTLWETLTGLTLP